MDWIEGQLDNESIFPQKLGNIHWLFVPYLNYFSNIFFFNIYLSGKTFIGAPFPPNFKDVVKTIFKRLFRVYAHIYHSHFQKIVSLKEEAHLNTCFKHFILFTCVSLPYLNDLMIFYYSFVWVLCYMVVSFTELVSIDHQHDLERDTIIYSI